MKLVYILMRSPQMHKQYRCPQINNIFLIILFFFVSISVNFFAFVHLPSLPARISKERIVMNPKKSNFKKRRYII